MIRAHQPGSQPIDIPEVIPNPAVVPKQEPAPNEPVRVPEKVPADRLRDQKCDGVEHQVEISRRSILTHGLDGSSVRAAMRSSPSLFL